MFWNSGINEWLTYGFAALVVVVCLGVIARAVFIPGDVRRVCCCGACGYPIADAVPNRCPECGGALTKVGISTPAMAVRLRGSLGWALLAWTVACGFLAQLGWGYVVQSAWSAMTFAGPAATSSKMQHTRNTKFSPQRFGFDSSGGNQAPDDLDFRIDADYSFVLDGSTVDSGTATLTLRWSGKENKATLDLDLAARTFELKGVDDAVLKKGKASEVDDALIKAWFGAAGIELASKPAGRAFSDTKKLVTASFDDPEGVDTIFQLGPGQPGSLQSSGGSSSSGPAGAFSGPMGGPMMPNFWTAQTQVIALILGAVYVTGAAVIWWRHRRLLA